MKKLTLAFTLLTSLSLAGTALADPYHRDQVADHRAPIAAPIAKRPPSVFQPPAAAPTAPAFRPGGPIAAARWDLLTTESAIARRGSFSVAIPRRESYDQLKLIPTTAGVDIMAVELSYGRGKKVMVRPASDGTVSLDVGRGKLTSISVRYTNRGFARGAAIKVLGKDDAHGKLSFR